MKPEEIKKVVREKYSNIAIQQSSCCQPVASCCGGGDINSIISKSMGYSDEELNAVPEGSDLGLGCGNPIALASLKSGEIVLDLGSGAGFDCFLAAQKVGNSGKVVGVDMTAPMIKKAGKMPVKEITPMLNSDWEKSSISQWLIILLMCSFPIV